MTTLYFWAVMLLTLHKALPEIKESTGWEMRAELAATVVSYAVAYLAWAPLALSHGLVG